MTSEALLTFQNLGKQYGYQWAVKSASGEICNGRYISLFGVNGAGKTTLLYLLSGVYRPHHGEITHAAGVEKDHMHLLSHQSMFYSRLNAIDNLNFFQSLHGKTDPAKIKKVLEYTGLYSHRLKTVDGYSRGMIQRLMIARLILARPRLVFFDEPFTGLDIQGQRMLIEILKQRGLSDFNWKIDSYVFVDHDIERAYDYCDHVWYIEPGKLHPLADKKEISLEHLKEKMS